MNLEKFSEDLKSEFDDLYKAFDLEKYSKKIKNSTIDTVDEIFTVFRKELTKTIDSSMKVFERYRRDYPTEKGPRVVVDFLNALEKLIKQTPSGDLRLLKSFDPRENPQNPSVALTSIVEHGSDAYEAIFAFRQDLRIFLRNLVNAYSKTPGGVSSGLMNDTDKSLADIKIIFSGLLSALRKKNIISKVITIDLNDKDSKMNFVNESFKEFQNSIKPHVDLGLKLFEKRNSNIYHYFIPIFFESLKKITEASSEQIPRLIESWLSVESSRKRDAMKKGLATNQEVHKVVSDTVELLYIYMRHFYIMCSASIQVVLLHDFHVEGMRSLYNVILDLSSTLFNRRHEPSAVPNITGLIDLNDKINVLDVAYMRFVDGVNNRLSKICEIQKNGKIELDNFEQYVLENKGYSIKDKDYNEFVDIYLSDSGPVGTLKSLLNLIKSSPREYIFERVKKYIENIKKAFSTCEKISHPQVLGGKDLLECLETMCTRLLEILREFDISYNGRQ